MENAIRRRVLHPVLATAYPALALHANNAGEAPWSRVLLMVGASAAFGMLLWWLLSLELKERQSRGVLYTIAIVPLLTYGQFVGAYRAGCEAIGLPPIVFLRAEIALQIALLVGFYFLYRRVRGAPALSRSNAYFNVLFACLVAISALRLLAAPVFQDAASSTSSTTALASIETNGDRPNIYLIVLDAYAGAEVLRDQYEHDNESFLGALEAQGFYVARACRSNYPYTVLSLGSLLNMRYILLPESGDASDSIPFRLSFSRESALARHIQDARVVRELRARGYRYVFFESGYNVTEHIAADEVRSFGRSFSEFDRVYIEQTAFFHALRSVGVPVDKYLTRRAQRQRVLFTFDELSKMRATGTPTFVFAHVIAPHPPFVFYADGSPRGEGDAGRANEAFPAAYAEYLRYINTLVLDAVSGIRTNDPDAVIVIQGDHGPRYEIARQTNEWEDYARDWLSTLNAVYVPEADPAPGFFPEMAQVNTFRMVFNHVFDTEFEPLPEMSYLLSATSNELLEPVRWEGETPVLMRSAIDSLHEAEGGIQP